MIIDKLDKAGMYTDMHPLFSKAFGFLQQKDLAKTEEGKYVLEGEKLFAMVQEYAPRIFEDCKLEAHRKYIDIQYIISGEEQIGVALLGDQYSKDGYIAEKDIIFYEGKVSRINMKPGMFAIFFPDDLHMPGIRMDQSSTVRKVVVKVAVR
jgi:YhcH/YjgK/YiaL family protein